MPRKCDSHPTINGTKGAVYALVDGKAYRLSRNMLLQRRLPDGSPLPPTATVVLGVTGAIREEDLFSAVTQVADGVSTLTVDAAARGVGRRVTVEKSAEQAHRKVSEAASRVAELGGWPPRISAAGLAARVPTEENPSTSGFDAGVAIALGMIPWERAALAAGLHAAYTPDAIAQVRRETGLDGGQGWDPDSEAVWWLAACSVCVEGQVDAAGFTEQVDRFRVLRKDPSARLQAAQGMLARMLETFEVREGVAWAVKDGGMQGAYLAGHEVAAMHASGIGLYFVGTHRTAGFACESFPWAEPDTDQERGRSGPVFGSRQFIKTRDLEELDAFLEFLRQTSQL